MRYLQGGMGYLKSAVPKNGQKERARDTKVERTSAEIYTGAAWTTASRCEHLFRVKELKLYHHHHTDGIIHTADS